MRIVERVEGHYDVQDVEFGRVYRWCPESFSVECEVCRKKATYKKDASWVGSPLRVLWCRRLGAPPDTPPRGAGPPSARG